MRATHATLAIAQAILDRPNERHFGYDLHKRAHVRAGTLYPILGRMLNDGWLTDAWETPTEAAHGGPPRRYYQLTTQGRTELEQLVTKEPA